MKLTAMQESPIKHVIIFGPPKAGKTELAGKLSEKKKLIWFDLEKGVSTLFKLPQEWKERIEVIKGMPVKICEEHGKVACPLCSKDNKPQTEVHLNALDNDSVVVIDSITQLTNSCISNITRGKPDDYKLERDDWGHLSKVMDMFFSFVQAAPFNIVCISHETEVEMNNGGKKLVPTAGSSNFARNFAKYFDEVVYCEVKNKKHIFASSTTYSNGILTGGRSGFSLESSAEPKLLDLWR